MWHGRSVEARVPRVTVAYIYNRNAPARPGAVVPTALTSYVVSRELVSGSLCPPFPATAGQ